jgi:hypothetical protein
MQIERKKRQIIIIVTPDSYRDQFQFSVSKIRFFFEISKTMIVTKNYD